MKIKRIPIWLNIYLIKDFEVFEFCTSIGEVSVGVTESRGFKSSLLWWNEMSWASAKTIWEKFL